MRNAIAAVLSARSPLPQIYTPANTSSTATSTEATTTLPEAITSVSIGVNTLYGENGSPVSTASALTAVTYTPAVVILTESEPSLATTTRVSVPLSGADAGPNNTSYTLVEITYTPVYSVLVAPTSESSVASTSESTSTTSTPTSSDAAASNSSAPTSSTSSQVIVHDSGRGLSDGAVAGVAIGCAIAGALIALGVLFLLMGDRLRKRHYPGAASSPAHSRHASSKKPGYLNSTLRHPKGGAVERSVEEVTAEAVLEQPKDDATIKQTVAALFKAIEDHADNYYVDTAARSDRQKEPATQSTHPPSGITAQSNVDFEALLADRFSRSSAITGLITAQILDAIDFFGVTERSLLPEIITKFLRSSADKFKDDQRSRLILSRWRTSTAALVGSVDSPERRAHSQTAIDALITDVDSIVGTYIRPETDKDRHQHLVKLCKRGQELGLLLLSQPTEWRFYWSDAANARRAASQTQRGEKGRMHVFVIQPQLRRVTDHVARKLDRPLIVLECQLLQ
ncbi:hypothetical protein A1O7_05624 [Cladophialophora yegresii CBS 114405]|uniref:Uncharacterized protein n=1 Tax=Cladophialophora yegresii CBS 114405 TaxID=1182544 RepID=W9WI72_9EURO|nr:uncharacterized protein A1O7_05624 [Cladophialophora yegresii CBS 114405]EXJ58199.1 hypothetical protein A1O7_05624 [Cladophialophora yegresii CBS 114405]